MSDNDKKEDGLFLKPSSNEENNHTSNLIRSLVSIIQHEVNIVCEDKIAELDKKVNEFNDSIEDLKNTSVDLDNFHDEFGNAKDNYDLLERDEIRDLVIEQVDEILDDLKITRA